MIQISPDSITERFIRYVQIDTQSDPTSTAHPTTEKQKDLSKLLLKELYGMGITNASTDEFGYVYATIPSNSDKKNIPVVCFCAHVDTAPDCSGTDVKPILHRYYDGNDIVLPDDTTQVLRMSDSPYLKNHINSGVITTSGLTLLGADDKSGVAAIMEAALFFIQNPAIKHGDIKILFTPDEEVGQGTAKVDMQKLGAQYGYTLDGGEAGSLEDETFSADAAVITVNGVIVHPGYAKGKLVNALKVAGAVLDALPKNEWSPETTEKREGFVHPTAVNGIAEKATRCLCRCAARQARHRPHRARDRPCRFVGHARSQRSAFVEAGRSCEELSGAKRRRRKDAPDRRRRREGPDQSGQPEGRGEPPGRDWPHTEVALHTAAAQRCGGRRLRAFATESGASSDRAT